jgi:hypothetical protein
MNPLIKLFKKYRSIGVVGNINTAKSSLVLNHLLDIKEEIDIPVYVLGAEKNLHEHLESKGINILHSTDDVLDMKIKNSVIYIDEFADIFDVQMASKQTTRIKRFFNRIAHLNNYIVISSAEVNFWNKFMCSLVRAHLVKTIEYVNLVRGTHIRTKIMNIAENTSEYRLDIPVNTYYVITDDDVVEKLTFDYNPDLDSKKDMVNPFLKLDSKLESYVELKNDEVLSKE